MKNIHILPTDKPICTCERPDYFCDCLLYDEKVKEEPKQSIKDRILSETPESVKQKVRETANELVNKLEPLEVPMPIYNEEELTYEEDLVKKIAVVLSVGNEAQAVRLIEKYVQYRLEPFEELVNNWHQRQIHYQDVAEYNIDNQHTNRKFTYKALATRDCWKELLTLINK